MNLSAVRDTWLMFQREYGCSVDRMLCTPHLRTEFLEAARRVAECQDEEQLLWAVIGLRKKKSLPTVLK